MKLENKKALASRTLNVGRNRIIFNTERLSELKEAITKQDIRDLLASGAIHIKEKSGRKTKKQRRTRRRAGSIKKTVANSKAHYVSLTRKLRSHLAHLKKTNQMTGENVTKVRKEIRASAFRSLAHMKEHIAHTDTFKSKGVKKHAKNTKKKKAGKKN
jgi:large subunit ribosomal protein L19e